MGAVRRRTATLRNGLRLPCAEVGEPGDSTPLVLVHAYVESWRYFEPVLQALPPTVHALAPTQRGHPSVWGDPAGYRLDDYAADVVDLMDAVGLDRAVLAGASSGGLVSQVVATGRPERVAGLVLISSPATLADKPGLQAMREEIAALSDPIDPRFVDEFVRSTSPDGVPEELLARLVAESLAIPARVWKESFLGLLEADRPQPLEDIRVPTLLLCGSDDAFVLDDQQVLLDRIPDAELVLHEGAGHGPHLADPVRVAADLTEFLRGERLRAAQR